MMVSKNYVFLFCLVLCLNTCIFPINAGGYQSSHDYIIGTLNQNKQIESHGSYYDKADNVIIFILDDIGVEMIANYKNDVIDARYDFPSMPVLNELIGNGVRFVNAYSSPTCSPTRAMIYTGRYSFRTGVGCPVGATNSTSISLDEITVPMLLGDLGYQTGLFGKWHLNFVNESRTIPNDLGFDVYDGLFIGAIPYYNAWNNTRNGKIEQIYGEYITSYQTDRAIEWLNETQYGNFFMVMAYFAPHTPVHKPPVELINTPALKELEPTDDVKHDNITEMIPYFFAMLESIDNELGRLLNSLNPEVREKTTVIILGDNGTDREIALYNENRPYNSGRTKNTVYEGGIRVPLVISGAGVTKPGNVTELVSVVDLFYTVFDVLGQEANTTDIPIDSQSLLPALHDPSNFTGRDFIYSEQFGSCYFKRTNRYFDNQQAIRNEKFKYIITYYGDGTILEEFFDLEYDPVERINLLDASGDIDLSINDKTSFKVDIDLVNLELEKLKNKIKYILYS